MEVLLLLFLKMTITPDLDGLDDKYDYLALGNVLEEFKEVDELKGIIGNLSSIFKDQIAVEMALERYLCE